MKNLDCKMDYQARTVGDAIARHDVPDHWTCRFDIYDDNIYPYIDIPVNLVRENDALMKVRLRTIENENDDESSEDDSEVQYLTMLRINDIEMLGDENGEEILLITLKETADVKYDHITIAVPSSYINWN